jgi:hypothetical protein
MLTITRYSFTCDISSGQVEFKGTNIKFLRKRITPFREGSNPCDKLTELEHLYQIIVSAIGKLSSTSSVCIDMSRLWLYDAKTTAKHI